MEIFSKRQKIYTIWRETRVHLCYHFRIALTEIVASSDAWSVKNTDSDTNSNRKDHVGIYVVYLYKNHEE